VRLEATRSGACGPHVLSKRGMDETATASRVQRVIISDASLRHVHGKAA
jgi:hypothetical protein